MKAKFVTFLGSDGSKVILDLEQKVFENNGMTHAFTSAEDAQQHSTVENYLFWDSEPVGFGTVPA